MTLVWLIFFAVMDLLSLLPSQAPSCILISEEANAKNYSGHYACASMHEAIFRFVRLIWDGANHDNIVALGTIAISIFTYTLWKSTNSLWETGEKQIRQMRAISLKQDIRTRESLELASNTAERQLRAYVFIDHASLVDFDGVPTVQVLIKNAGQTPAYNVVAWNAVQLHRFPLAIELVRPDNVEITRCNSGPGMSFHLTTKLSELREAHRAAIRAGVQALYVFGRADYVDAFGRNRFLQWRLLYGEESARRPDGSLRVHSEGNDAN
jgi:hypothetical protein